MAIGSKQITNYVNSLHQQRHHFANNGRIVKASFSSSHAWMWELDYKESWALKNFCFRIVVLEKSLESFELWGDQTSQS